MSFCVAIYARQRDKGIRHSHSSYFELVFDYATSVWSTRWARECCVSGRARLIQIVKFVPDTVHYHSPSSPDRVSIWTWLWLGLCKLENEILIEAKNPKKSHFQTKKRHFWAFLGHFLACTTLTRMQARLQCFHEWIGMRTISWSKMFVSAVQSLARSYPPASSCW